MNKKKTSMVRGKSLTLIVAVAALALCVVGGTVAYLYAVTGSIFNSFVAQKANVTLDQTLQEGCLSSVVVNNPDSEKADCFVRVALIPTFPDGVYDGAATLPAASLGAGWVLHADGYYYYTQAVTAGASTGNLLAAPLELPSNLRVDVLVQALQSIPAEAVLDAWGVDPTSLAAN